MTQLEQIKEYANKLYDEADNLDDSRHYLGRLCDFLDGLPTPEVLPHIKAEVIRLEDGQLRLRDRDSFMSISMIGAEHHYRDLTFQDDPIPVTVYITSDPL